MFLGKYTSSLHVNNRIPLPSSFREEASDGFYFTQGFERDLLVLTTSSFEKIYQRIKSLNITDPLARLLLRMLLSTAKQSRINDDGYITIPAELAEFAELENEVIFIGQGDYFEIWAANIWQKQEIQLRDVDLNETRFSILPF